LFEVKVSTLEAILKALGVSLEEILRKGLANPFFLSERSKQSKSKEKTSGKLAALEKLMIEYLEKQRLPERLVTVSELDQVVRDIPPSDRACIIDLLYKLAKLWQELKAEKADG
jgi:hypothetical protein